MRVIAGKAKGHPLQVPKSSPLRPTTGLVRGALFSILEGIPGEWKRVLDLYAGTGALGIEALSRGAGWVDFVEREPRSCAIIRQNLKKTGFEGQARVYCSGVEQALTFLPGPYNLVFLDPPYASPSLEERLKELSLSPLVEKDTTVVALHSSMLPLKQTYEGLHLLKERRHGGTSISIFQEERT